MQVISLFYLFVHWYLLAKLLNRLTRQAETETDIFDKSHKNVWFLININDQY